MTGQYSIRKGVSPIAIMFDRTDRLTIGQPGESLSIVASPPGLKQVGSST